MKWAEVIMVRSAGRDEIPDATLQDLMNKVAVEGEHVAIRVFRRERLDSDICIVLFHKRKKTGTGGSTIGLHLVAALKEIALVDHTIWNEIDRK